MSDILNIIKDNAIEVVPVIKSGKIIRWVAGFRKEFHQDNYTPNHLVARGSTLEEAVEKLMRGDTLYSLGKEGELIENPENK